MSHQAWASIGTFAIFAAVLTVTPGLDTMLVLRTTAATGRRAGFGAVFGVLTGCLVWAIAGALGVTAVLAASRVAFDLLRVAGAVYLCWLGAQALWRARRERHAHRQGPDRMREAQMRQASGFRAGLAAFRTGLTSNLLNPKVGVFYLSILPQFLPDGVAPLVGSLALGAVHVTEGVLWLGLVVFAVSRARDWFARPVVRRRLEALAGVAFLGFGVRLALDSGLH
ncbi:MAG TPA: LysE family translocator [Micromonosporaceae bacterium]